MVRNFALLVFAALLAAPPASADNRQPEPAEGRVLALQMPAPAPIPDLSPSPAAPPALPETAPESVPPPQSAGEQPVLKVSEEPVRRPRAPWILAGAAIGLAVGLLDEDPIQRGLIGGALGLGLSYVIRR